MSESFSPEAVMYARSLAEDLTLLGGSKQYHPAETPEEVADQVVYDSKWLGKHDNRWKSVDPDCITTAFGRTLFSMLGCGYYPKIVDCAEAKCNYVCSDAEPKFAEIMNYPNEEKPKHSPVIIVEGNEPVGIVKAWGERTILGLAKSSMGNPLIYPGSIADSRTVPVRLLMRDLTRSEKPVCMDVSHLKMAVTSILGLPDENPFQTARLSGLVDPVYRRIVSLPEDASIKNLRKIAYELLASNPERVGLDKLRRKLKSIVT